ncbi:MAG: M20/M25/M40 family metallo-hydrolase [Bacteroidetes bacterium]|nr:M20/M25/M40 family metallo-hydrolase [Bacteroidota bacterium]
MRKLTTLSLLLYAGTLLAQTDAPDAAVTARIREEGLQHSQVMDIAFHLTDVSGPRLTGSPGFMRAANWAKKQLGDWGLQNAALEAWGVFGKSWELQKCYVAMTAPYYRPLIAFPKAWCSGTNGLQSASLLLVEAKDSAGIAAQKGSMKGKIVLLVQRTDTLKPSYKPDASRFTDDELDKMASYQVPASDTGFRRGGRTLIGSLSLAVQLRAIAKDAGAIAALTATTRGFDGTVFVQGGGAYTVSSPENFLDVVLTFEDFNMLYRLAKSGVPVQLDMDVKTRFSTEDPKGYNVIAEIKGSDPKLKEELIMLGGHLDSWQGGVGATDNAAGCAVMMEAVRILTALKLHPKRTVRIALWSGEEEGLLGSRNYVRNHFTDTTTRRYNAAGDKLSVYFNLDNGSGKIRGIYTQENEAVKPLFTQWLAPFGDLGAKTVTLRNTGGTDHLSFDGIGLPGFQFMQDPIEYDTRTHHSNMDTYDHLQADDLKQAATIVASFVYNAGMRAEKLPRKPATVQGEGRRGF